MSRYVRTPQETFLSDQALAAAREEAKIPGSAVVVLDYATDGQCSWCDCTTTTVMADLEGHGCGGCAEDAEFVLHHFHPGGQRRTDIPVCGGHKNDAVRFLKALLLGRTPD